MSIETKEILEAIETNAKAVDASMGEVKTSVDTVAEKAADLETRMKEMETFVSAKAVSLDGVKDEKQDFSFLKAVYAIKTKDWSNAGFEAEVFENTRKTAMAAGADTTGGYIVPTQYINDFIELLNAESVIMRAGATTLNNLIGSPVEIPKQTGGAEAYWVGENESITESNPTYGQVALTPKACAALVKMSNRLLKLSNPSAEAMVRRDIALAIALKIDLAGLTGTGSAHQPLGIANTANINTVAIGANGGTFDFTNASDMENELRLDNAFRGNMSFIMHPTVAKLMKQLRVAEYSGDTAGSYLTGIPMSDSKLADSLGYKFYTTTQIGTAQTKGDNSDCSNVYFGNWNEMLVGNWGGLELMASNETSDAFQKNQTWVRAIQEVDVQVRHAESFCLVSDARIATT